MWKLVVTDRVTGPIWPMITIQAVQSARAMSVGPDTVPPGRLLDSPTPEHHADGGSR